MKKIKFEHPALDKPIMVEGKFEVCPRCHGTGGHERDDIDCSALVDSMREDGDEEGLASYFNGGYDVLCTECNGRNVVFAPILPKKIAALIDEWHRCEREYAREVAAERRMGA